jgi:hypothetical protein
MRHDADCGKAGQGAHTGDETPAMWPASLEELRATAERWRNQPEELSRLREILDSGGGQAVPSYRIGSAEGTVLFAGLNGLGEIVKDALDAIYEDIEHAEDTADSQRREQSIETLAAAFRALGETQR